MGSEQIDKLLEKCLKEEYDKEFLKLKHEFCDNRYGILNFLSDKKVKIVTSLLEKANGKALNEEAFYLLDALKYYQEALCFKLTRLDEVSIKELDVVMYQLEVYDKIVKSITSFQLEDIEAYAKILIKDYLNSDIYYFYVLVLLEYLKSDFWNLDEKRIKNVNSLITDTVHFQKIIDAKKLNDLEFHVVSEYIKVVCSIREFISDEEITEDVLIKKVLNGTFKNKRIIKFIVEELSLNRLLLIFGELKYLFMFISSLDYLSKLEKEKLYIKIISKCKKNNGYSLLIKFYLLNNNLEYGDIWELSIDDIKKDALKNGVIDDEVIWFLLESIEDKNFLSNSMFVTDNREIKDKLLSKIPMEDKIVKIQKSDSLASKVKKCEAYNLKGELINYDDAKELLEQYFLNKIDLNSEAVKAIIRAILMREDTKLKAVLFMDSDVLNGEEYDNIIFINNRLVRQLLDKSMGYQKRVKIFQTAYHELAHVKQENKSIPLFMEYSLKRYDVDYYERNYDVTEIEKDANYQGNCLAWLLLQKLTLPFDISFLLDDLPIPSYEDKRVLSVAKKKVSVFKAFQKLVAFHPELGIELANMNKNILENDKSNIRS